MFFLLKKQFLKFKAPLKTKIKGQPTWKEHFNLKENKEVKCTAFVKEWERKVAKKLLKTEEIEAEQS